ncbi:MAG: endonuclease VII domain-containing protein [Thaumarchaeota archaeon]|nr:endonuclease VII domain-containing protein [Nitrososphaerota archaeon]
MKICRDCLQEKEKEKFIKNKLSKDGIDTLCLDCNRKRVKAWRNKNPEKKLLQSRKENKSEVKKNRELLYKYNISLEDYNKLFIDQNGCCAICKVHQKDLTMRLAVDHCHTSNKVRSLLCTNCNTLLGQAKESIEILTSAISYLQEHGY